jgi:hypothetical protein
VGQLTVGDGVVKGVMRFDGYIDADKTTPKIHNVDHSQVLRNNMSKKDLAKIWQKLSTYLVLFAAATWAVTQGISPGFGVEIDQRRQIAALLGLVICIPLYWVCLWFAGRYAVSFGSTSWHSRLPPVGLDDELDVSTIEGRMYQRFCLAVFVFFPLAALTHFYNIFIGAPVREFSSNNLISMWNIGSPMVLFQDAYRYGESGGVTFFPFYEPMILTILFAGIWVYSLMFGWKLIKK